MKTRNNPIQTPGKRQHAAGGATRDSSPALVHSAAYKGTYYVRISLRLTLLRVQSRCVGVSTKLPPVSSTHNTHPVPRRPRGCTRRSNTIKTSQYEATSTENYTTAQRFTSRRSVRTDAVSYVEIFLATQHRLPACLIGACLDQLLLYPITIITRFRFLASTVSSRRGDPLLHGNG